MPLKITSPFHKECYCFAKNNSYFGRFEIEIEDLKQSGVIGYELYKQLLQLYAANNPVSVPIRAEKCKEILEQLKLYTLCDERDYNYLLDVFVYDLQNFQEKYDYFMEQREREDEGLRIAELRLSHKVLLFPHKQVAN